MAKTFLTPKEYCRNKLAHRNSPLYHSDDGKPFIFWEGEAFTYPEFKERYPIDLPIVPAEMAKHWKGENPNKKTESMRQ